MSNLYKNVIKPILTNEIIINWVAPIITGILVIVIPALVVKFFRFKKDTKKIKSVNDRFINSIRPYIIQKIEISSELITDIRKAIIMDSDIKEKFVFSENDLKNKLIMDINESKYIDEINKKELIDFTYKIFKDFKVKNNLIASENINAKDKRFYTYTNFLKNPIFLLIISQILIVATLYFDKSGVKPEDNYALLLPLLLGIFSIGGFLINFIFKLLKSDVYEDKIKFYNYDYELYKIILSKLNKERHNNKTNTKD